MGRQIVATYSNQTPTKDASFNGATFFGWADRNCGNGTTLYLNLYTPPYGPNRTAIEFDLTALAGLYTKPNTATLGLYCFDLDASAPGKSVSMYRLKRYDWEEGTGGDWPGTVDDICWYRYKAGASWQVAGGTGADDIDTTYVPTTTIPASPDNWMEFSGPAMLSLVQDAIANRNNKLAVLLKGTNETENSNCRAWFRCREYPDSSLRPRLVVTCAGHPYISRVQGIPGMRTFSQLGHGGM